MSNVKISQKEKTDSNNQKPNGKSVTESLTGILKEDDLDARKAEVLNKLLPWSQEMQAAFRME